MMAFSMIDFDEEYLETGPSDDLDRELEHTAEKSKSPTSPVPAAEKQHEDDEEDFSKMAKDFKKIAEKVSKAIPRRYHQYSSQRTIYVARRDLVEGTMNSYEPELVCIGPLFDQTERRKKPRCKLESYKWCCVRKLLVNAGAGARARARAWCQDAWIPQEHETLLEKCFDTVSELEPRIRKSYDDDVSIPMDGKQLALMMLLDGCFILHYLLSAGVWGRYGGWGLVTRDLLLLKNQIPFIVLEKLFAHLKDGVGDEVLIKAALGLFAQLVPGPGSLWRRPFPSWSSRDVHHLLHLFYLSIVCTQQSSNSNMNIINDNNKAFFPQANVYRLDIEQPTGDNDEEQSSNSNDQVKVTDPTTTWRQQNEMTSAPAPPLEVPCAMALEDAGVTFQAPSSRKKKIDTTFLDVSFQGGICHGILEIPPLELSDNSEALFRNLIAFEQAILDRPGHVTAYALFMDCLIKTPEDTRLLRQNGVLVSLFSGERDVATGFFSRVCSQAHTHISPDQNYLEALMRDVTRFHRRRWPRWRTELVRDYFSNPWVTSSVVAALLLLLMTMLQTFFTVYAYFKPPAHN